MTYTPGSILSMTPASGTVVVWLTRDTAKRLPLIGWAVVVSDIDESPDEIETDLQPVALYDGMACTRHQLGAEFRGALVEVEL